jgi:hypothetical protein
MRNAKWLVLPKLNRDDILWILTALHSLTGIDVVGGQKSQRRNARCIPLSHPRSQVCFLILALLSSISHSEVLSEGAVPSVLFVEAFLGMEL